jgi:hypothetical protein
MNYCEKCRDFDLKSRIDYFLQSSHQEPTNR